MRLYVTYTFKGTDNRAEIEHRCDLVRRSGWEDFCFIRDVEDWQPAFTDSHALMARALEEIRQSDALLLDMTRKPTGRAIEAGMAYTLGKRVILIMQRGTVIKDTSRGISNAIIEYDVLEDIVPHLTALLDD